MFTFPDDLRFNREMIQDPEEYFKSSGCHSWLFLVGEEFQNMPGGMSFEDVKKATGHAKNVISDPPRTLTIELARQQIEALEDMPRPTLISCRSGPRASALAYLYAGLKSKANPAAVLEAADQDNAPFTHSEEIRQWLTSSLEELSKNE